MALPQIYSRRKRLAEAGAVDVYQYEKVSDRLRVQVIQIIQDALGADLDVRGYSSPLVGVYEELVRLMRREVGVHQLVPHVRSAPHEYLKWLEAEPRIERWLDGVELAFRAADILVRDRWREYKDNVRSEPDKAIEELNARFREDGFGYQFVSGEIIRFDSLHAHQEIVLPALELLRDQRFAAANQEYRDAHAAYRADNLEDCLVGCGKALESVLKVIGHGRGWSISDSDPASKLVQAGVAAGFLPAYSIASLNHLKGLIESSTPTVRNRMGGHGAGTTPRSVPRHLAAYQLHQTAAVILFLVEHDASLGP